MSSKTFHVYNFHHPVEKESLTVDEIIYRRQTIATLKKRFAPNQDVLILLDKKKIEPENYKKIKVSVGSRVDIIPTVGFLAALIAWAGPTLWAVAVNVAWAFALSYLGAALFNQDIKEPKRTERDESQSFGWSPHTIQKAGVPVPKAYGRNMHTGNILARWTDVDESGDEILYLIVCHGEGPTEGYVMVYINDQPVGNFTGLSIQERVGTFDQTCMTGFEKTKLEYSPNDEITYDGGAYTFTTPNEFFDDVEYTLAFDKGIWYYNDMGERQSHSVGVKVQISVRGANTWTTLLNTSIVGSQMSAIYKAYKASTQGFTCVRGTQYDLKVEKTTADRDVSRYGDSLSLRTVREVVDVAFTRPGKALIGITALATERLSGSLNIKVIRDDRLVRTYDGTSWDIEFSRNRAWVCLDEVTQPVISGNSVDGYEVEFYEGLNPSKVDLALIYEWAEWCDTQVPNGKSANEARMTCDFIVDYETDVWTLIYELFQVGRFYPYWQGNTLTGWIDKEADDPIDLVTFDNMMTKSWVNAWSPKSELAGNMNVFYRDMDLGYERKSIPVHNENAGVYTRTLDYEGTGVNSRSLAHRIGWHALERNRLIRNVNTFKMYKDAVRYKLGDILRLQCNVPNWGKSYRVVQKINDYTVELDRNITAAEGDSLYVRSYDSVTEDVVVDSYTVDSVSTNQVTIQESAGWDIAPEKNFIVAIGTTKLRRIIKIVATPDNYFEITVETYDEDLFDADATQPDSPYPNYVWPAVDKVLDRPITRWEVLDLIHNMIPNAPDVEIPWMSNIDWSGNDVDTVYWTSRSSSEEIKPLLFRYRGVTYEITEGETTDEFIYWDPDFTTQFRSTASASVALASGNWLVATNKSGVAYPANPFQLIHAGIILAGTIRAESYAQLRSNYVYNSEDSLDSTKPFTIPFRIVEEADDIVSAKLSFRLMPYRAYSTTDISGGGSTPTTAVSGYPWPQYTDYAKALATNTDSGDASIANHNAGAGTTGNADGCNSSTEGEDGDGVHYHYISGRSHGHPSAQLSHSANGHVHGQNEKGASGHRHELGSGYTGHTHSVTIAAHQHGLTYGIHEESNSPTVTYAIDDGLGFGAESAGYNADQQDIDISGVLTIRAGTGWKALRFTTDLRCRVFCIIEFKLDITA